MFQLEKFSINTAIISENGKKTTFDKLNEYINTLYSFINKRCLVLHICTNTLGSLVGYISCINNRVIPLMISSETDKLLLENFIKIYKPDFVYLPSIMKDEFKNSDILYSDLDYSLIKTKYDNAYKLNDDLALLLTTSGSTGSPKLVRQSYKNIKSNTESIIKYLEIDENERAITSLPMHYTYGLSIINTHIYSGASIVLTDKSVMQKEFWSLISENKVTSLSGVPYTYEMLYRIRFMRMKVPSLKTLTQAGGKLPPKLHLEFAKYAKENNKKFIVMYGQTEATSRMSYLPYEKSIEKFGSMGIPIPGGKFLIVDTIGNEINEVGKVGELKYLGDNVTLGYAEQGEDLIKGDELNGSLLTGDMAKFDEDGYFYIVGRKKRFLKIFGNRINLDEVEHLIKHEFENIECACIGIDDNLIICLTKEIENTKVIDYISSRTVLNKIAFKVKIIPELPKSESGKIVYKKLEEFYVKSDG